ncbi:MAG TPA: molybdate ABC transporter substrate-binding protein [Ramlibacter sp.]
MRKRCFLGALALGPAALAALGTRALAPVRVAAASDLKFALAELARQYQSQAGSSVQLSLGSSGQFVQQIRQGLPVDLYMSADEDFVFQLADAGLTRDRGALYALGRIAAVVAAASPLVLDPALEGLRAAGAGIRHFAIANPEHAPYGRAAREALERLGLWQWFRPKLVLGENIAQATQFVTSGAAQAGITALSLALAPEVARLARHVVLPDRLHAPLRQRMVLLKSASAQASEFYAFLQTQAARAILRRYGFAFD